MQITRSIAWVSRYDAWRKSYAAACDADIGSAEDRAESEQFDALLLAPCATPLELHDKLEVIGDREVALWKIWPDVQRRIEGDLQAMSRENVSAAVADAFASVAKYHLAGMDIDHDNDEESGAWSDAHDDAISALIALPCVTPGDFMVKAYIGLLDGAKNSVPGFPFLPTFWEVDYRGERIEAALFADLKGSDLGRRMMVLGGVEFDAKAWLAAASRAGISVFIEPKANSLSCLLVGEELSDEPRCVAAGMVRALLGGHDYDGSRVAAVKAHILAERPDLIARPAAELHLAEAA